jgi:hypothetical protein
MSTIAEIWSKDWEQRLRERLRSRGFSSAAEFLRARPGASYEVLAEELGDDVAPIQVTRLQLAEAKQKQTMRPAAADMMARVFRAELPDGWGRVPDGEDVDADYLNASAFGSWAAPMKWTGLDDATIARIGGRLKQLARVGWMPVGPDDETIAAVLADDV